MEFPDKNPDLMYVTGNRDSLKLRGSFSLSGIRKPRGGGKLGHNPHLWYSQADAVRALGLLLSSADELGEGLPYRLTPQDSCYLLRFAIFPKSSVNLKL